MTGPTLPPSVLRWADRGSMVAIDGDDYFVVDLGPREAAAIVLLHGFPGSSFDWHHVADRLVDRWRVVSFDSLGFGLSDKPADGDFSLFRQADRVERLLEHCGVDHGVFVLHDVGDTVGAELLQRLNEGRLATSVPGVVLLNGSIFIDLVQLSAGQQFLLSLPDEALPESLGIEVTANAVQASFPAGRPAIDELEALVALVHHRDGDRLMPRIIRYIDERRRNQDRWTAGLRDFAGPVALFWGDLDPIAVPAMADRLALLRTTAGHPVTLEHWRDVGHWPNVEVPERVAVVVDANAHMWTT